MQITTLSPTFSVSPQLLAQDLDEVARRGFRMVVNNRPDGEEPGQPVSAELEAAARKLGLDYRHIPVVPGGLTESEAEDFAAACRAARGPVLAFCRTGARSTKLWSAANARSSGPDA
jgi:sulfide:quinone oxidoreductase